MRIHFVSVMTGKKASVHVTKINLILMNLITGMLHLQQKDDFKVSLLYN